MNCPKFREIAVHALLGKAAEDEIAACREHVAECSRCAADSKADLFVLDLLRSQHVPPTSEGFRRKLTLRFENEIAHEPAADSGIYLRFHWRDRIEAELAWIGYRMSNSRPLQLVAAAAMVLVAVGAALAILRPGEPKRVDVAQIPAVQGDVPDVEPPVIQRTVDPTLPREVAHAPPGGVVIDPADRLPPPEVDEPTAEDLSRQRARIEAENRRQMAYSKMRSRFAAPNERSPVDRALRESLRWLVEQQDADGAFDPKHFEGMSELRVGVSGLVTLALISDARGGVPGGVYDYTVSKAIAFLRASASPDFTFGKVDNLGERNYEYTLFNHAIATAALAEHRILTKADGDDPLLREALLRLSDLSRIREPNRVSTTDATTAPWVALAFETARDASLVVDFDLADSARSARTFVVGLADPNANSKSLTIAQQVGPNAAASAFTHQFGASADRLQALPPETLLEYMRVPSLREPTRVYFVALDLWGRNGGDQAASAPWSLWRTLSEVTFLQIRKSNGEVRSEYTWDWISEGGGSLYTTALTVLTLSVERR